MAGPASRLAAALAVAVLAGCGGAAQRLEGTWEVDLEAAEAARDDEYELVPEMAKALVKGLGFRMEIEFGPDGKAERTVGAMGVVQTQHASWKIVESAGDTVVVELDPEDDGATERLELTFEGEDRLLMRELGSGREMVLTRVEAVE